MTIKLLEPERYKELGFFVSPLAKVVVAEDDNHKIVGYAVGQPVWHLEPMWVDESLQKTMVPIKLWSGALACMASEGIQGYYTQAATEEHADYLMRLGLQPLPYIPFAGVVPEIPSTKEE